MMKSRIFSLVALLPLGVFAAAQNALIERQTFSSLTGDPVQAFMAGDTTYVLSLQSGNSALYRKFAAGSYQVMVSDSGLIGSLGQNQILAQNTVFHRTAHISVLGKYLLVTTINVADLTGNPGMALYDCSGSSCKLITQKDGSVPAFIGGKTITATVTGIYWPVPSLDGNHLFYLTLSSGGVVTPGMYAYRNGRFELDSQPTPPNAARYEVAFNYFNGNYKIDGKGRRVYVEEGSLDGGKTLYYRIVRLDPKTGKKETLAESGSKIADEVVWTPYYLYQNTDTADLYVVYGVGNWTKLNQVQNNRAVLITDSGELVPVVHPQVWRGDNYPAWISGLSANRYGVVYNYSNSFVSGLPQANDCQGSWMPSEGAAKRACTADVGNIASGVFPSAPFTATGFTLQSPVVAAVNGSFTSRRFVVQSVQTADGKTVVTGANFKAGVNVDVFINGSILPREVVTVETDTTLSFPVDQLVFGKNDIQVRVEGFYSNTYSFDNAAIAAPAFSLAGIASPFTDKVTPLVSNTWTSIYGANLADAADVANPVDNSGSVHFPFVLGSTQVLVNGSPAPLWIVGPGQINFLAPRVDGKTALVQVVTVAHGQQVFSKEIAVPVAESAPGLVRYKDWTAAFLPDGTMLSPEAGIRPKDGDVITVYGGGFGPMDPDVPFNQPALSKPLAQCTLPVTVTFTGGITADVTFCGLTPGTIGLGQLSFMLQIPDGTDVSSSLEGVLKIGDGEVKITL